MKPRPWHADFARFNFENALRQDHNPADWSPVQIASFDVNLPPEQAASAADGFLAKRVKPSIQPPDEIIQSELVRDRRTGQVRLLVHVARRLTDDLKALRDRIVAVQPGDYPALVAFKEAMRTAMGNDEMYARWEAAMAGVTEEGFLAANGKASPSEMLAAEGEAKRANLTWLTDPGKMVERARKHFASLRARDEAAGEGQEPRA